MFFSRAGRLDPIGCAGIQNGMDDIEKPIPEQLKNRLRQTRYALLYEREDFQALMQS